MCIRDSPYGSGLTGVIGIGSGFVVQDSGSAVGTASTVNFGDNLSVQFSVGIATIVGAAGTDNIITDKLNVTGISTLQNNVLIGSGVTLSPDGDIFATGITTVGILTVTGRVRIGGDLDVAGDITYDEITGRNLNITGVSTFTSTAQVGSGITLSPDGNVFATGVTTSTTFSGNLTGNVTGDVTGTSTNATNITLADESSDTTCNVLFATGTTGNLPAKTGTNLTFNSNTGDLAATSATLEHTFVGSAVTVSQSGINAVGVITATGNIVVGAGVTISPDGDIYATGITTFAKQIVGISTNNLVPFLFNNYSDLPSASDYHGQFAHVHVAGKAFYAHAGAWYELINKGANGFVGLGTEKYNVGVVTTGTLNVGMAATIGIVSFSSAGIVTATSGIVTYYGDTSKASDGRWNVTASGTDHFVFAGIGITAGIVNDPTLYLARGRVYEFVMQQGGTHPFRIQSTSGTGGTPYPHGVSPDNSSGATSGVLRFEVPMNAPNTLFYQCTSHTNMVGILSVFPAI